MSRTALPVREIPEKCPKQVRLHGGGVDSVAALKRVDYARKWREAHYSLTEIGLAMGVGPSRVALILKHGVKSVE